MGEKDCRDGKEEGRNEKGGGRGRGLKWSRPAPGSDSQYRKEEDEVSKSGKAYLSMRKG